MKIGELAKWAQCPAVTIRYYEKIGLLTGDKRDRLNHRVYGAADIERLRFILHCRNHGISTPDIRVLLAMRDNYGEAEGDAAHILRTHIENLKKSRESLDRLIDSLTAILSADNGNDADSREIIDALGSPCPHCPDYQEKINKGLIMDKRSSCLANPAIRKSHIAF